MKSFQEYLEEAKKPILKEIPLGIKGIDPKILGRAEVIGGIKAIEYFKNADVQPLQQQHYQLKLINGEVVVVLSADGKRAMKNRTAKDPKYTENVTKLLKQSFTDYFKKLNEGQEKY